MAVDKRDELCDQTAARHTFQIPGGNQDITPHKLTSGEDWLTLDFNARGETWYGTVQSRAADVRARARHCRQPRLRVLSPYQERAVRQRQRGRR